MNDDDDMDNDDGMDDDMHDGIDDDDNMDDDDMVDVDVDHDMYGIRNQSKLAVLSGNPSWIFRVRSSEACQATCYDRLFILAQNSLYFIKFVWINIIHANLIITVERPQTNVWGALDLSYESMCHDTHHENVNVWFSNKEHDRRQYVN